MPLIELFRRFVERQRRHRERIAASKRLGRDESAWAELFRRDDWKPLPAGHLGRCGRCGGAIELARHDCPHCGAEWGPNARRGDLTRQIVVIGAATALSVLTGYASAAWLRGHFAAMEVKGQAVNPEMVDTLASFSWLVCGVVAMIAFTYAIEHFHLAPIGHWRKNRAPAEETGSRRKSD